MAMTREVRCGRFSGMESGASVKGERGCWTFVVDKGQLSARTKTVKNQFFVIFSLPINSTYRERMYVSKIRNGLIIRQHTECVVPRQNVLSPEMRLGHISLA